MSSRSERFRGKTSIRLAVDFESLAYFTAAQARWSGQDIFLFVGAFGPMGHHLPGMIRAYGDRALFQRFRTRFIVAPLALLAVCVWSSLHNIEAIQLVPSPEASGTA